MGRRPKAQNSRSEQELDNAQEQFDQFENQVNQLTVDSMSKAKKHEEEPQTKLSQNQIANSKDIYLKPKRTIFSQERFNEAYRESYEFDKQYVHFIAENKEIIGESIDMWTKPYPGLPAEEWIVPTNKPVWAPRYVAEQIRRRTYHRLKMDQSTITDRDGMGTYTGGIVVDTTINRLEAYPVSTKRSVFI